MKITKFLISWLIFLHSFPLFSYYASTLFPAVNPQPRAIKRQRLMTTPQARSAIIASPQNQVVIQSPQTQQQIAASKLTSAANSLIQLQQQQQMILASTPVVNLCNSISSQNFVNSTNNGYKLCSDNIENVSQQCSAAGPFKVYSKWKSFIQNWKKRKTGRKMYLQCRFYILVLDF